MRSSLAPARSRLSLLASMLLATLVFGAVACGDDPDGTGGSAASGGEGGEGGEGGAGPGSSSASTGQGTGGAGGSGGGEGGEGAGGPVCIDSGPGEPNDVEQEAYSLGDIGCSDGAGGTVYGVLDGSSDVDWYLYVGADTISCLVNPTQELEADTQGLRLCAFFECVSAETELSKCPAGTTPTSSPGGRAGCCGTGKFEVKDLNCKGTTNETAKVFLRVDAPGGGDICAEYKIKYNY